MSWMKNLSEAAAVLAVKNNVEKLIRGKLTSAVPVIEIAGSYAKGNDDPRSFTIWMSYATFKTTKQEAGDTLEEIYNTIQDFLSEEYAVRLRIPLFSFHERRQTAYHCMWMVPGRFVDDSQTDCFLYQNDGTRIV